MKQLLAKIMASRPVEAWNQFSAARGTQLAGGITYSSFFSLFPALAAGFTVFAVVLENNVELQESVVQSVNDTFGTPIIKIAPDDEGIVLLSALTNQNVLTVAGLLAFAGLIFTGIGWIGAVREGVRAMFGRPVTQGNFALTKLRDLGALVAVGLVVLASALSGIVVNTVAGFLLEQFGQGDSFVGEGVLRVVSALVLLAVDFAILLMMFRFVARIRLPRADLRDGALIGAVALGVVKVFAGLLLSRLGNNQFLATFAVAIGLLVWLNLIARIILLAAAWGAVTALERGHLEFSSDEASEMAAHAMVAASVASSGGVAPAPVATGGRGTGGRDTASRDTAGRDTGGPDRGRSAPARTALVRAGPAPIRPTFVPIIGARSADRVSVAAGAVLGASAAVVVKAAASGIRTVFGVFSRDSSDD